MSFIRNRSEEKTGFQDGLPYSANIDFGCDFVMVYRMDASTPERIKNYRQHGYEVHLMTGISWGAYKDYLYGEYDGEDHWDEAQTDRFGNQILHGKDCPYMVPTVSFANYITESLKKAVDAGIDAIHVEEPEFWDRAGYSEAFRREYEIYYHAPWTPPHSSADARYKCAKLKQYLYTRTIDRVSAAVKEYAAKKYGRKLRFFVPTHSLLNYTQWKIVSPEGKLADLPCVDGCIAQVWTGTAREENWYRGVYRERTFETAYLEYGVMQELVKGTGRRMWFLHDPIEDNPVYDWNDYRNNYLCTVAASLLHPGVNDYEICPWPHRVFEGKYPRNAPDAVGIPKEYATLLNNLFQTLGDMPTAGSAGDQIGILMADSQLYQRGYPDSAFSTAAREEVGTVLVESDDVIEDFRKNLIENDADDRERLLRFAESSTFPAFYGISLPLLKNGMQVRPVLLDNVRRYPGYLDDYKTLIVSYEYLKPESPDMNLALAEWVKRGGTLIYVGDGTDPYHMIRSWWTDRYPTAAEHLFELLGSDGKEVRRCGKGLFAALDVNPVRLCFSDKHASDFFMFVKNVLSQSGIVTESRNHLIQKRGPYVVAAVMDESSSVAPLVLRGDFVDLFEPDLPLVREKTVHPGSVCLLYDLKKNTEPAAVIGTSVRILRMDTTCSEMRLRVSGASGITAYVRLKIPFVPANAFIDGGTCEISYDESTGSVLLRFESVSGEREIRITN